MTTTRPAFSAITGTLLLLPFLAINAIVGNRLVLLLLIPNCD
jgi:hypothetical protein